MRVAINGFGRIGRVFLRAALDRKAKFNVVAINHSHGAENAAYLLKYDSVYGKLNGIEARGDSIIVNRKFIKVVSEREPLKLPWKKMKIDVVIECTGAFTKGGAEGHLKAGAKRVIISAPSKVCPTHIPGINIDGLDKRSKIINMGSCTTNALAMVVKILNDEFGIVRSFYNTVHAYTNDQALQDQWHKKTRRGRAASVNIIPTTSGASESVIAAIPEMKGKLKGLAIRVPAITGSVVDLTAELEKDFTVDKVNKLFKKKAKGELKGLLDYTEDEIVSTDIIGNSSSGVIDGLSTMEDGNLVKVLVWYDNEWGYSNRLIDLLGKL